MKPNHKQLAQASQLYLDAINAKIAVLEAAPKAPRDLDHVDNDDHELKMLGLDLLSRLGLRGPSEVIRVMVNADGYIPGETKGLRIIVVLNRGMSISVKDIPRWALTRLRRIYKVQRAAGVASRAACERKTKLMEMRQPGWLGKWRAFIGNMWSPEKATEQLGSIAFKGLLDQFITAHAPAVCER
jgi:hypothetical protein